MESASAAISQVFVYGTLLSDDVVCTLLTRVPPSSPAILHDFHRFSIKGRVYPAILPVENKKVTGRILMDLTPPELHILDEFEDNNYERRTVDVFLKDGSQKVQAHAYVWGNNNDPNLYGEWDFEEWKILHMEGYVSRTEDFAKKMAYESFNQVKESDASSV